LKEADCEEVPRVAVIKAVVSVVMLPIVTPKVPVRLPADTLALPGTVIREELEPRVTVVALAGASERVIVHELEPPDIAPEGEHVTELTAVAAVNWMDADADELL
jgi:hypothetical protein